MKSWRISHNPTMLNLGLITFLAVASQISGETCLDSSGVTVCIGLTLKPAHKINIKTNQTKLCVLHGDNTVIPASSFTQMSALEGLYFNTTNVREVSLKAFDGLDKLRILGFFGNRICAIEQPVFQECNSLETLDLSGNDIESLSRINWVGLEKLKNLYVIHNFIRTFSGLGLETLKELEYLDLSLNYLESLHSSSFQAFKTLIKLNLAANRITTIENDTFNGLVRLEQLNLEGNHLKEIEVETIMESLPTLKRIYLEKNRFNCGELKQATNGTSLIFCDTYEKF